jgi:hypothetical protein
VDGVAITGSHGGTTTYAPEVHDNDAVSLTAPSTVTSGGTVFCFQRWTLNGTPQTQGQLTLNFSINAPMTTVVAEYSVVTRTLTVQSTPITGAAITGSNPGTTNYSQQVAEDSAVSLTAPLTFTSGGTVCSFQQWTLNGTPQTPGHVTLSFNINVEPTIAVAGYLMAVVCVDDSNQGAEDGTPAHPFRTIQAGIGAARTGGTIKVAKGTYTGPLAINAKQVEIRGGYVGGTAYPPAGNFEEASRDPDPVRNATVIDGGGAATAVTCVGTAAAGSSLVGFRIENCGAVFKGGLVLKRVICDSGP